MTKRIDILVAEPSEIIVEGLSSLLSKRSDYSLLAPLHDATILEERVRTLQPDLLLLNPTLLSHPEKLHLAAVQQAAPSMALVAVVYQYVEPSVLSLFPHTIDIREARNRIAAIVDEAVQDISTHASEQEDYELSDRETQVLVLIAQGLSSKEIADRLCISIHTVNTHRKNITHKTGIRSVAGLAVYAMLHNLA